MEVTVKKVEITLPEVDMALLKELAKKFGWNIGRKKSGIEKGLEDIKAGRVYKANGRSKKAFAKSINHVRRTDYQAI
ncbi:hypothetical protein PN600_16285 [Parabacteroides distasonis]|uniref:hypothetical protein n=1 Tax=Parabacteroides distasonis TaxID=823 RepID=UPI001897C152|nr:hypothetical protein [Parabacteroides distasonis]MDB9148914.1 hypothetical protein [Parabacteroides distasonis]